MKQLVIMPGGFHPFHAGHMALYNAAKQAFPSAEVYVAATNDTSQRPFPFAIKEKLAKLAGVEAGHFVQVKSPFRADEITQHYDPADTALIFVRSTKDQNNPPIPGGNKKDGTPGYLQPLGDTLEPMTQHAYMDYLPTVEFGPGITSATEIRNAWPTLTDKRKTAMVMSLYPKTQNNPKLATNVAKMLNTAMGTQVDEMLGFQIARVPTRPKKAPASLSTMRKEFDKEPSTPVPNIKRVNGSSTNPKYVRTVTAEAFDQPYSMKWEKSEHGDYDALTRLPDGSNLSIMFNLQQGDEGEEAVQVEFYRNNSQEVTGAGDAQRVFATVLLAIQQYIKKRKPAKLTFSASKDVDPGQNSQSRANLYDKLVQRYARAWGYRALRADNGNLVMYELTRVKPAVQEGISLHDVAWIGNLIPSFIQRVTTSGTREAKQTLQLGKILGKWVGTGELTPGEEAFAKQQLIDIAKMIASMAVASAVTASAPAHAAASAVASGVTHIAQHGAVDLGLDALAVMLSKNFKFDFLKKVMHSLETDSGKAISHVEKKAAQAPQDTVDKQVNQQFQQAKMGFGGMSESIDYVEENHSGLKK